MSEVVARVWSGSRAARLCDALGELGLLSPPDPRLRPTDAPPEPDRPVFYAYRRKWWRRWEIRVSLHWLGEYTMNFDDVAWKVRHEFGVPRGR